MKVGDLVREKLEGSPIVLRLGIVFKIDNSSTIQFQHKNFPKTYILWEDSKTSFYFPIYGKVTREGFGGKRLIEKVYVS
tara:strand:- start:523 stop:759 length:237 start_codon:yes stop_codon:yes gene_type:complete